MDKKKQRYVMNFIDFGLKTKEEMDEITSKLFDKVKKELNVEIFNGMITKEGDISKEINDNQTFALLKKKQQKRNNWRNGIKEL